jgi:hypothetical protein
MQKTFNPHFSQGFYCGVRVAGMMNPTALN